MGLFDFLKGILGSKSEEEKSYEKVEFSNLKNWIQDKSTQITANENAFLKSIKTRISTLTRELEEETNILEKINVDKRKVDDRIKFIVKSNLDAYIIQLRNLISNLNNLELNKIENAAEKIRSVFDDFEQKSAVNFQKITFLIGNDLVNLGKNISKFFKDLKIVVDENKDLIKISKTISLVKSNLDELDELENVKAKFNKNIKAFELSIEDLKNKIKSIEKNIEKVKTSKEYAEAEEKKEKLEANKTELKNEISQLKDLIDFKFLANAFHSDEKKMNIIKNYRNDFEAAFNKNRDEIVKLLDEAKINKDLIQEKIKAIAKRKEIIEKTVLEKNQLGDFNIELEKIKLQIENLNSDKNKEQKKHNKFEADRKKIMDSIKNNLNEIDIELLNV